MDDPGLANIDQTLLSAKYRQFHLGPHGLKKEKEKERSSRASHTKFISSLRIQINLEQTVASGQATLAKNPYHSLYKHILILLSLLVLN